MNRTPKILLLILSGIFIFLSCKKEPEENSDLPKLTHEGKNTFGCYLDGAPYVAQVDFTIGGAVPVSGFFDEEINYLNMQGVREDDAGGLEKIVLRAFVEEGTGIYTMYANSDGARGYQDFSGAQCTYYHDQENLGTVVISYLNTTSHIISGTFEMDIINPDCFNTTMKITDGRFDFGY